MTETTQADLGGQPGQGRVVLQPEGELFHAAWEPYALALTLAMGATGVWNIDMSRSARETLPDYASLTYYRIWLTALENLLVRHGLVQRTELAEGRMLSAPVAIPRTLYAADVGAVLARGAPTLRSTDAPMRFALGDRVRTCAARVAHHTRLPGYAHGKFGRIERCHGAHVFADAHAQGLGERPQWLYTVVFEGQALWGADACAGLTVSIDAWDPYLEPA